MIKFFKKRLIAMSIVLTVVLPHAIPADKSVLPQVPGISTINASDTSYIPLEDEPEVPKP